MNKVKPTSIIAVTPGSEHGIGPELMLKALNYHHLSHHRISWCGDKASLERAQKNSGLTLEWNHSCQAKLPSGLVLTYDAPFKDSLAELERPYHFLMSAILKAKNKEVAAIVTGPIEKNALLGRFLGQTEMFAHHLSRPNVKPMMTFMGGPFILSLVSTHVSLNQVAQVVANTDLHKHFIEIAKHVSVVLKKPYTQVKIDVLGLNPHAGEQGLLGTEDALIEDAILKANTSGLNIAGPWSADGYFAYFHEVETKTDVVVAMYHDQGLIPYKLLSQGRAVNVTMGLTVPRTSPAHGTAPHLTAKGLASELSTLSAIETALFLEAGPENS